MHRRPFVLGTTTLAATLLAGCSGNGDDGSGGGNGEGGSPTTVEMVDTSFDPMQVTINVGGTVKWVNKDSFEHDVTATQFSEGAADWSFQKTLSNGQSTTHIFESEGVYEYYCTIHGESSMCGVVIVGDVSYDGSLPCQDDSSGGY